MLEGLAQIRWSELEHAYGSAADVPELIRALCSSDPEDEDSGYRHWESLDEQQQDQLQAHIELAVYDAVRAGVPLYRMLLADNEPEVRVAAAYALAWFSEDCVDSAAALLPAVVDPHAAVAATALVALGLIGAHSADARRTIEAMAADQRDVVRWGAAVSRTRLDGPAADKWVDGELLAWAGGDSQSHPEIPYLNGDLAGHAALALRQLGDGRAQAVFDALMARIPVVSGPQALPVVAEALRWAFPAGPVATGTRVDDLDARQRRLLRVLADSPATWGWKSFATFGNFSLMVSGYGLPHDVEAMRAFLT